MANLGNYPSTPDFSAVNFRIETNTQTTRSLSLTRFRNAIGTTFFTFTAQYPPMTRTEFKPVMAFIAQCRGPLNEFDVVIPELSECSGNPSGSTALVNGGVSAGTSTISVDGLAFSTTVLKAGDVVRFAGHTKVYMVTSDVTSSGTGTGTINITPPLKSSVANNEAVTIDDVPFRMTLNNDTQEIGVGVDELYQFEVDMIEVL
jgi:hypothetical protein